MNKFLHAFLLAALITGCSKEESTIINSSSNTANQQTTEATIEDSYTFSGSNYVSTETITNNTGKKLYKIYYPSNFKYDNYPLITWAMERVQRQKTMTRF